VLEPLGALCYVRLFAPHEPAAGPDLDPPTLPYEWAVTSAGLCAEVSRSTPRGSVRPKRPRTPKTGSPIAVWRNAEGSKPCPMSFDPQFARDTMLPLVAAAYQVFEMPGTRRMRL
jgi:hypothetical protein